MEEIDPDSLYDDRTQVPWSRPILQGDVFENVSVPALSQDPITVQIVAHPCAMRRGPVLRERITIAPVEPYQRVVGSDKEGWEGHLRVMPLADLRNDGKHHASMFLDVTAADASQLSFENRIASLSNRGLLVLHQRLIKHYTRLTVDMPALRKEAAPILEEAEQQQDWIETVLGNEISVASVLRETSAYQQWLSDGQPSRRELLAFDEHHRDVRRLARAAATQRAEQLRP